MWLCEAWTLGIYVYIGVGDSRVRVCWWRSSCARSPVASCCLCTWRRRPGTVWHLIFFLFSSLDLQESLSKLHGGWRGGVRGLERECSGWEEAWRHQGNALPLRYGSYSAGSHCICANNSCMYIYASVFPPPNTRCIYAFIHQKNRWAVWLDRLRFFFFEISKRVFCLLCSWNIRQCFFALICCLLKDLSLDVSMEVCTINCVGLSLQVKEYDLSFVDRSVTR